MATIAANGGRPLTSIRKILIISAIGLVFQISAFASMEGNDFETTILKVDDNTLRIGQPLTVVFYFRAGIFTAYNVTGKILPGEGYDILTQPQNCREELKRGDTVFFLGQIQPIKSGTWKVELGTSCLFWDGSKHSLFRYFFIELSDTLNRAYTSMDYIVLPNILHPKRVCEIPRWNYDYMTPFQELPQSKPISPDSVKRKSSHNE